MSSRPSAAFAAAITALAVSLGSMGTDRAFAQGPPLTLPQPSQAATVSQTVGLTEVTVTYHRPRVQGREIWGKVVPYGEVWRAGANENTTIAFSTPVEVEGHVLPAGSYGFHTLPSAGAWQLIFSAVDTNWGSFSYDEKEDLLRVEVTPEAAPHEEALAYTFDDATAREATVALRWEKLRVPFKIRVDTPEIVYRSLQRELRGLPQFFWQPWNQAATTLLTNKIHLDDAMVWVDKSIAIQKNFANSFTKSRLLAERGDAAGAKKLMDEALPGANEVELNAYGYQLLGGANSADAIAIFRENVKRHPGSWNAYDSLGEGLAATGKKVEAAAIYRKALAMAPEAQKARIQGILDGLQKSS